MARCADSQASTIANRFFSMAQVRTRPCLRVRINPLLLEKMDVFHEGRQRHVERFRQVADACGAFAQPPQHRPPRGVGKRLEDAVKLLLDTDP